TQIKRASLVEEIDYIKNPKTVLAVAIYQKKQEIRAGGILYDLEITKQIDSWLGEVIPAPYPYIRTYLTLRNKQPLRKVINKFQKFDLLMVEGAGRQHPRYFGLACELGLDLDIPTVGITQRPLLGKINFSQPLEQKDYNYDIFPVLHNENLIAYFISKKSNRNGIFLSIGHKITLLTAVSIILPLLVFKLPEPLRIVKMLLKRSTQAM
ncbi:MAG: endonuclease V, partial [Candidatus Hodarchaeota archaeon]